ncbi:MAG TPA: YgeY family selenium metabolism-linked hydrolase [Chloroflexi bacterium]|nr:YgeY family selenium metabolism-linked hydrolase [Chloroflexota bacterium]|tara:strand:- start:58 stop:1254 length:1197 start_codon:yes stop_codon:yes gene_type:complete
MSKHVGLVQEKVREAQEVMLNFFREIVAIPSMDGQIGEVGKRVAREMDRLGFDNIRFDKMGNIMGRVGSGSRILVYDSHIDTVGVGSLDSWEWDPFEGKIEDGVLYARGACDEKGSTPGMIYGMAIAQELGFLNDWTIWYFGNMEEWCDGIAANTFVEVDPMIKPDYVVIGEPTNLEVYRGQKGRLEMEIVSRGRSAHAASNHLGDNAIYNLLPIIDAINKLEPKLGTHEFLGGGKITVTDMHVKTASINAVPDEAVITIDRRMTLGETREDVFNQVKELIPRESRKKIAIRELFYDEASYTGYVYPVEKYFPAWLMDNDHPLCLAGQATRSDMGLKYSDTGKWDFSTNGIYWAGKAEIPSIGFGPGEEETAHTVNDSVRLDDVVKATEFYALLPNNI